MLGMVSGSCYQPYGQRLSEKQFHGFDISKEGFEPARREARQIGLTNTTFEVKEDITSR
jgi:tRNA/tmRNA/rRNA uracil-C5-methylase (TrmA/RlmC/RlmD family)